MGLFLSFHVYNNQVLVIDCMNRMPISMSDLNNYDRQQSIDSWLKAGDDLEFLPPGKMGGV